MDPKNRESSKRIRTSFTLIIKLFWWFSFILRAIIERYREVIGMNITISEDAHKWFKEEMNMSPNESIRFYVRYGGYSPIHEGFSLGISKETPEEAAIVQSFDGIRYYIEERDKWYLDGYDMNVDYDEKLKEPKYSYTKR